MKVKDCMNPRAVTVGAFEPVAVAARVMARQNVGMLPVRDAAGRLVGVVTDRDIVLRCVAAEEDPAQTMVRDIMTRSCTAVSPHADCRQAARLMSKQQVRRLPVVEGRRLIGMVTLSDLSHRDDYAMEAAEALSEITANIKNL